MTSPVSQPAPHADAAVRVGASPAYLVFKGVMDRLVAAVLLVPASILFAIIAIWVRMDSAGPIIFRQTRGGLNGRPFGLLKFRTMRQGVDPYGDSPSGDADPRITRSGRWLRRTSLDELPQLVNVLRGEMSLVGPRPLYVQMIDEWNARQRSRLLVKPGLTGFSQIHGRASLTVEEKLEWDVRYVEQIGFKTDLWVLWRTLFAVWSGQGLFQTRYSERKEKRSVERPAGQGRE